MCVCLFIALTSRLESAIGEDLMTSRATWQHIIAQCTQRLQQELDQEEHRNVTYSIESLSAAVCDVFRHRQTTNNDDSCDKHDVNDATSTSDDDVDAKQYGDTEEYSQILD